jgi:tetratricopeptide (TPR) repeat protein
MFTLDGTTEEVRQRTFMREEETQRKLNRLRLTGDECLKNGDTKLAIESYDEALKTGFNEWIGLGKAKALIKLGRLTEAAAILRKVNNYTTSPEAWNMRVECFIKLGQYVNAFAVCDEIRKSFYPEQLSYLLRAKTFESMDKKEEAKKCLLDGITHCIRYEAEKQDLVDELYALGSEPLDVVPKSTIGNKQILSAIKDLVALPEPLNQREIYAKFKDSAYPSMISGAKNDPVANWSGIDRNSPIEQVSNTDQHEINIRCNLDLSYITAEDLEQHFGQIEQESSEDNSKLLRLECPYGHMSFRFNKADPSQLYFVVRTFTKRTLEDQGNSKSETFIREADQLIKGNKYREAENMIVRNWHGLASSSDTETKISKLKTLRDMLVKSEAKRPEVQEYLKEACLLYIQEDVDAKNRFGIDFPTAKQFEQLAWHRNGMCIDPSLPDSYYVIYKETYPAIYVSQDSALFRQLCSRYGREPSFKDAMNNIISPKLIDDTYSKNFSRR